MNDRPNYLDSIEELSEEEEVMQECDRIEWQLEVQRLAERVGYPTTR